MRHISQIDHLAAVNLTIKSVSSIIPDRHKRSQLILVFLVIANRSEVKMQNLVVAAQVTPEHMIQCEKMFASGF